MGKENDLNQAHIFEDIFLKLLNTSASSYVSLST